MRPYSIAVCTLIFALFFSACPPFAVCVAQQVPEDIINLDPAAAAKLEARLVTNVSQITLDGTRAGEGYLSADGNWIVFQSERSPDNPYFQIFLMNLKSGDLERISPGHGKTTCAWIHPDLNRILFASTQDDPDALKEQKELIELRAGGKTGRSRLCLCRAHQRAGQGHDAGDGADQEEWRQDQLRVAWKRHASAPGDGTV